MTDPQHSHEAPAENPLSEREREVAALLATGASNAEIARELIISPHTVKVHVRNIFEKLQVNSRTEASMLLVQRGWVQVAGVEPTIEVVEIMVEAPPPLPEPAPLASLPPQLQQWQRLYLLGALLLALAGFVLTNLPGRAFSVAALLSDGDLQGAGQPAVRLEPRWELRTPAQEALSRSALVRLDDHLYLIGGEGVDGAPVANVAAYQLPTNEWLDLALLPNPLENHAAAVLDDAIYVAGGTRGGNERDAISNQLLRYRPADNRWEDAGTLPQPLAGAAMTAVDGELYLIGGWDGSIMRDEIWRLEPGSETGWELAGHLERARAFLGAATVGSEIYIAGGFDGQRELDLAAVFTPATGELRALPPMSVPRGGLSLVYDGLAVFALGGGWNRPLTTHERIDPSTGEWSNFSSPIQGSWRTVAAAAADDRLHLIGGWSGDYLDLHLQYQSSFRSLLPVITID
jgi:DNA-binding CsgD family transcriptional regulator